MKGLSKVLWEHRVVLTCLLFATNGLMLLNFKQENKRNANSFGSQGGLGDRG